MTKRSIWAVGAGLLVVLLVTTLVDFVLHAVGAFPPMKQPLSEGQSVLALSYRVVITVAGAWLTALLAPDRPMKHAIVLGYVGTVLGLVGVVTTWNAGLGPRWYPISLAVLAVPLCWLGGRIHSAQSARK